MDGFMRALISVWTDSGFSNLTWENCVMILVGLVLLYLSIAKEYEPLLLLPIAFGCIMANFPNTGFEDEMGVMMAIGFGIKYEKGYQVAMSIIDRYVYMSLVPRLKDYYGEQSEQWAEDLYYAALDRLVMLQLQTIGGSNRGTHLAKMLSILDSRKHVLRQSQDRKSTRLNSSHFH